MNNKKNNTLNNLNDHLIWWRGAMKIDIIEISAVVVAIPGPAKNKNDKK